MALDDMNIVVCVPAHVHKSLKSGADAAGRSLYEHASLLLGDAAEGLAVARSATAEDVRLMIREEIRAALAADRAAQAEASEILMRETVETMRVGMAAAERRAFTQSRPSNWVV